MKYKSIFASWKSILIFLAVYYATQIFMPSAWHYIVTCTQDWWKHDGAARLVGGLVCVALFCAYKKYIRWQAAQRKAKIQAFYEAVKKRAA